MPKLCDIIAVTRDVTVGLSPNQFVVFKPLSYCFEEAIGFDVKASFASRPVSYLSNQMI